jgi:FixJ family two-component response regulator
MAQLKMMLVDDDEEVRECLLEYLKLHNIECEAYSSAEELLARLYPSAINEPFYMPDLIIIDLRLKDGKMQGVELIKELAHRDVPCELMAISGVIPSLEFADDLICFGAATLLTKPFDLKADFYPRAKRLAEIGQKRRMKTVAKMIELSDESRRHRPVFLSYANEERQMANGIRRHIESYNINVWYAPTSIRIGRDWKQEIRKGIETACVFIPLISDCFLSSDECVDELGIFLHRIDQQNKHDLLVLPIVCNLSDRFKNSQKFQSIAQRYQYSPLRPRASDCLTTLLWRIQTHPPCVNMSYKETTPNI